MAGEQEKEAPGPVHKRKTGANGSGTQLKSPEKKKRKSSAQAAQFSHLSEFAPPPTPMVDHLVASNPFDDDFTAPKGAGGAPPGPYFSSPAAAYGGFRPQPSMPPHLHAAFSPGVQPIRRQTPPHFGPGPFAVAPGAGFGQPSAINFGGPPFSQTFSGTAGGFNPMLTPAPGPPMAPKFVQPPGPFNPSPAPRPNQGFAKSSGHPPPNPSTFPSPDRGFPPVEDASKTFNRPAGSFNPGTEQTVSPAAVNGNQTAFGGATGAGSANFPTVAAKNPPGHRLPSDPIYPCGFCLNEVNDDQDAILCEASCQKWFHRECTGMTETAYGLLTTETSAVWACDFCLKSKEIQSVYLRESLGQPVVSDG
ncbi:pygopus homolog 2-like [Narcine bancroftii]|uniref:pygopus homolog 2-like n=1 Tax=Narcine bancroftii TaxID=1343680 RepID=UPI0038322676